MLGNDKGWNEKGFPLVEFLSVFLKKRDIQVLSVEDLETKGCFSTYYLIVFLPSCFSLNLLSTINYKKLVLADYNDQIDPLDQSSLFKDETKAYFKFTKERSKTYDWNMGLLPVKFNKQPYSLLRLLQSLF